MLKMRWNPIVESDPVTRSWPPPVVALQDRVDLKPRKLLDDPRLRRACGLDPEGTDIPPVKAHAMPELRFDRRRLLEAAAA